MITAKEFLKFDTDNNFRGIRFGEGLEKLYTLEGEGKNRLENSHPHI